MELEALKLEIKKALDTGALANQDLNNVVDADKLRKETADKLGIAYKNYLKAVLTKVFSGVPVPQDGGTAISVHAKTIIAQL